MLMLHATCSTGGGLIQSANATQLPQAQSSNFRLSALGSGSRR
jgi:hypothetical protein